MVSRSTRKPELVFPTCFACTRKSFWIRSKAGEHQVRSRVRWSFGNGISREIQWLPRRGLARRFGSKMPKNARPLPLTSTAQTYRFRSYCRNVKSLIRNLLAAYLRLQEVNRQKTVFLASAAHELKTTPLAVIKGYYDLLLFRIAWQTNGQASATSCRNRKIAASGWFGWSRCSSTIPRWKSGKLVPAFCGKMTLRDCLGELATAMAMKPFVRKQVRLTATLSGDLPIFQVRLPEGSADPVANLLDNRAQHTPLRAAM